MAYCGSIPACLANFAQFATWVFIIASISSGVIGLSMLRPPASDRRITSGSASARANSRLTRMTMSRGVFAGTSIADHATTCASG